MKLLSHDRTAVPSSNDLYEVLGARHVDDAATLRTKFQRLCRLYHPDASFQSNAAESFKAVNAAYGVLSDPEKRAVYDEFGIVPPSDIEIAKEAESLLVKFLDELFNSVGDADEGEFEFQNPLEALQTHIATQVKMIDYNIEKERAFVRKMEKMITRVSRTIGDNMVRLAAQQRLEKSKRCLFKFLTTRIVFNKLVLAVNSYRYAVPERPKPKADSLFTYPDDLLLAAIRPRFDSLYGVRRV